jgi:hypothetical protein
VSSYALENFLEALDLWIEDESPEPDLRLAVTAWILTRFEDPYAGVAREAGFPNLWFGPVPGTAHEGGKVVVCSLWINERTGTVRCDTFATLNTPV